MASEWEVIKFGDCAQRISDIVQPHQMAERTPYIGLEHIVEGGLQLNGQADASEATSAKTRFRRGDVLFGKLRPYFRKVVRPKFDGICSTDIWAVRAKNGSDQGFLFYRMASQEFIDKSMGASTGTRMPRADWGFLSQWEMPLPPLAEQKAIASILGALDDKIELNRRMNATLEGMARALFQSWFVDFDPVRAKLDGRKPEGMDKATAALFPDAFQDSSIGPVPKGWTIRALADVIDVKHGFAFEGKYFSDERCGDILLTPGNFAIGGGFKDAKVKYYIGPVSEDYILCDHDLVLTMTDLSKAADTLGYPAMIPPPPMGYRYLHNQRIGKVHITQSNAATPLFLYRLFCSEAYRHEILAGATGTTVKHTSPTRIRAFKSLFPSAGVLEVFEKQLNIWYLLATQNESQSRTLATLRDTLLPKLLSGELSVAAIPKVANDH